MKVQYNDKEHKVSTKLETFEETDDENAVAEYDIKDNDKPTKDEIIRLALEIASKTVKFDK